jgi:hypothetical protein
MKRLLFLFLLATTLCQAQLISTAVSGDSYAALPPSGVDYAPTFTAATYPVTAGGSEYYALFLPTRYYSSTNSGEYYKTVFWYNGDGADGNPTVVTNQALVGSGTSWSGTFTNGVRDVIWGTVVIKVAGVEVARGQWNETILGEGITGTFNANGTNGTISVTFTSVPAGTPTVSYVHTPTSAEGIPKYLYEGDTLDGKTIVVVIHKAANNTFYLLANHFTDPGTYLAGLGYRIDPNRKIVAGLSRGGFSSRNMINADYTHIAGALICATGSSGITMNWAALYDRGIYWVGGQNDPTAPSPHGTYLNTLGTSHTAYRYQPWWLYINGGAHNDLVWNTNFANRSTAPVDWVEWASRWNLDIDLQAEQNVEIAETSLDIDDYRFAARAVSHLSAGAVKTALLARLVTAKSNMDGSKKRWYIDAGATLDASTGINNAADFDTGVAYNNINDDTGAATTVDFSIVSQMNTTGTNRVATNVRTAMAGFGFKYENYIDNAPIGNAVTTGQVKWAGLDNAKTYTVTFYPMGANSTSTIDLFVAITIGGVTKTAYTMYTNVLKIEFTGISPTANQIVVDVDPTGSTAVSGIQMYMLEEEI